MFHGQAGGRGEGHGGCCANANTSTRRENRMSHTFRNPGHFRFPSKTDLARTRIRHHPLIVDGGRSNTKRQTWRNWSLKPDAKKKKKKRTSQAALYGHQNNRSAEYIRYRADFSSREVCTAERASRSRKQ